MSKTDNKDIQDIDIQPEAVQGEVVDLKRDIPRIAEEIAINDLHCDDITKLPQGQFNYILLKIHDMVFYDQNDLCINHNIKSHGYDIDKIINLCEIYIYLCHMYSKHICIHGFSCISGIDIDTLLRWQVDKKASRKHKDLIKKLDILDEQTITDKIISLNNPVGLIAYQNNKHGWNTQTIRHEHDTAPATTAALAEQLGLALPEKS